ncbi:hypothetical protein A2304_03670 [Candidatus Uhrbacteria bacterium RIFOXYB2_FULL_57_15]|uniref:Cell shape-determining protein MreC n=1 Tax=Candidatus Uhrbacteria bacterium RIFOXYB2_FULL_57_15 TaxID=1802422 RepID=A0A1F7W5U0_9BACT|nr:MAG: hypothetical protein A2304_03670 [Candidatus Uhrbacteria bacterium RIFOXYB2_FULL_57_15]OGL99327.1 MAG: hypothetical protein A2501_05295 [Candidatus Uhrbacteria bacterium RIFOXYC12_FULL_57_11]
MRRLARRTSNTLITIAALALVAFVFRGSVMRVLAVVQRPLVAAGTWVSIRAIGIFDQAAVSPERLSQLEAQREAAIIDHAELERLRIENEELRAEIGFVSRSHVRTLTAAIVSRSVGPEASAFVIDRGSDDGVEIGDPAVTGNGVLVGKVVAVTATSATVRVVSDRDSATAIALLNGTRTIGIAQGISGALLALHYIPQDERVAVNDIVVTSGLEDNIPSGLIVGIVNTVTGDPTAPFQEAVIEPLGDVRRIYTVSVIVSGSL